MLYDAFKRYGNGFVFSNRQWRQKQGIKQMFVYNRNQHTLDNKKKKTENEEKDQEKERGKKKH